MVFGQVCEWGTPAVNKWADEHIFTIAALETITLVAATVLLLAGGIRLGMGNPLIAGQARVLLYAGGATLGAAILFEAILYGVPAAQQRYRDYRNQRDDAMSDAEAKAADAALDASLSAVDAMTAALSSRDPAKIQAAQAAAQRELERQLQVANDLLRK